MAFEFTGAEVALDAGDVAGGVNEGLFHIATQWGEALGGTLGFLVATVVAPAAGAYGIFRAVRGRRQQQVAG